MGSYATACHLLLATLVGRGQNGPLDLLVSAEKPAYRWYFRWLSLLSSLLCIHIMLAVSWKITNAAIFTYLKFYVFIKWEQSGREFVLSPRFA